MYDRKKHETVEILTARVTIKLVLICIDGRALKVNESET